MKNMPTFAHRSRLVIITTILCLSMTNLARSQDDADLAETLPQANGQPVSEKPASEDSARWQYSTSLPLAEALDQRGDAASLVDVILDPAVFSLARPDLADVRIFNDSGEPHPYALRTMRPESSREEVAATEFNRLEPENGVHELTLELPPAGVQHNQVRVITTGDAFRRLLEVDGSDDGQQWGRLVTANLLRFAEDDQKIDVDSVMYADSRFRFLRIRVHPDPAPSATQAITDPLKINEVKVLRTVELPGERSRWDAIVEPREPTRIYGAPGSSWILDLQGMHVPCDRLDVDIADDEFVREIQLEAEVPSAILGKPVFESLFISEDSTWQRKLGEPTQQMTIRFPELQTTRLRLLITDYQNAPLTIRAAQVSADARQVVFSPPPASQSPLRLYVGNPLADAPNYDFARNLPRRLDPAPLRLELAAPAENANFVPPPLPFTERFPWLIYFVLATVAVLLLIIIASLASKAVALHDAEVEASV